MEKNILDILKKDGVGVIPTDTVYGLVGSAFSEQAVERIYKLKGRDTQKPFIILIDEIGDLERFEIFIDEKTKSVLSKIWPGEVTVILPCGNDKLSYLHRGTCSLAFRIPDKNDLCKMLSEVGPIVAPSANLQDCSPAISVEEARKYFEDNVDFYQDGGLCKSLASTIVSLSNDVLTIVRSGAGDDLVKKMMVL